MELIKRAWKGEEKLWKVFWLYGLIGYILMSVLAKIISIIIVLAMGIELPYFFTSILLLPYFYWITLSEWRCAWNAGAKFWGVLVRIWVVMSVILYVILILNL